MLSQIHEGVLKMLPNLDRFSRPLHNENSQVLDQAIIEEIREENIREITSQCINDLIELYHTFPEIETIQEKLMPIDVDSDTCMELLEYYKQHTQIEN